MTTLNFSVISVVLPLRLMPALKTYDESIGVLRRALDTAKLDGRSVLDDRKPRRAGQQMSLF